MIWEGELHNTIQTDIISVILALLNKETVNQHGDDDNDDDDDKDDE